VSFAAWRNQNRFGQAGFRGIRPSIIRPTNGGWLKMEAFDLLIGASATDIRHTLTVNLQSTQALRVS